MRQRLAIHIFFQEQVYVLRSQLFYKLSIGLLSQYFFGGLGNLNAAYIFKSRAEVPFLCRISDGVTRDA